MKESLEIKLTHINKEGKVEEIREILIFPFWTPVETVMEDIAQAVFDEKEVVERKEGDTVE